MDYGRVDDGNKDNGLTHLALILKPYQRPHHLSRFPSSLS